MPELVEIYHKSWTRTKLAEVLLIFYRKTNEVRIWIAKVNLEREGWLSVIWNKIFKPYWEKHLYVPQHISESLKEGLNSAAMYDLSSLTHWAKLDWIASSLRISDNFDLTVKKVFEWKMSQLLQVYPRMLNNWFRIKK